MPGHSSLFVHSDVHVWVCGLHTGVSPGHSAVVRHATHLFVGSSHTGVGATHFDVLPAMHSTQMPSGNLQTGSDAGQFALEVQPTVHSCCVTLHLPFRPEQFASELHSTQTSASLVTLQTGLPGVHAETFDARHSTHSPVLAPVLTQAGLACVEQAPAVPAPRSPSHATHVPAALQIGVAPEHCALVAHCTQV